MSGCWILRRRKGNAENRQQTHEQRSDPVGVRGVTPGANDARTADRFRLFLPTFISRLKTMSEKCENNQNAELFDKAIGFRIESPNVSRGNSRALRGNIGSDLAW